jgi:hypothetical protein
MRVEISEPRYLGELGQFLEGMGCVVEPLDGRTLLVSVLGSYTPEAAELEIDMYLKLWEVHHPGARAERLG